MRRMEEGFTDPAYRTHQDGGKTTKAERKSVRKAFFKRGTNGG